MGGVPFSPFGAFLSPSKEDLSVFAFGALAHAEVGAEPLICRSSPGSADGACPKAISLRKSHSGRYFSVFFDEWLDWEL